MVDNLLQLIRIQCASEGLYIDGGAMGLVETGAMLKKNE